MDDGEAIRRCAAGNRNAFGFLVERYQAEALGHAAAIVRDREDAREAVQEAFVDAFRSIKRFDPNRRFYPWFYTLLRHRCYKFAAKRSRASVPREAVGILAETGIEETLVIGQALAALSPREREILTLRYFDGLSYAELARFLAIPQGTVMSRLYEARRRLKQLLETKR